MSVQSIVNSQEDIKLLLKKIKTGKAIEPYKLCAKTVKSYFE